MEFMKICGLDYQRLELKSGPLGKTAFAGRLCPPAGTEIQGTLYFLHGGDSDDRQWIDAKLTERISPIEMSHLIGNGIQIVLPSIGLSFLRGADRSEGSHWHHFKNEVLTRVERDTNTTDKTRWITGISMGGHGAVNAFLRHPELFAGCGAHFPGLIDFNPFSDEEAQSYRQRSGITDEHLKVLLYCFRSAFANFEEYRDHDPIELLKNLRADELQGRPIYLDVGSKDEFGLQLGAAAFSKALSEKGVKHVFEIVEGELHHLPLVQAKISRMLGHILGVCS